MTPGDLRFARIGADRFGEDFVDPGEGLMSPGLAMAELSGRLLEALVLEVDEIDEAALDGLELLHQSLQPLTDSAGVDRRLGREAVGRLIVRLRDIHDADR